MSDNRDDRKYVTGPDGQEPEAIDETLGRGWPDNVLDEAALGNDD